ncbi:hypothetical protein WICPIJ_002585 [Wickerhamomyces pijperi]|uniref:Uncharacterized protein n=1 Tax=Wickerhamomyces pijperi TaxID=599730 RepID=A0A9P8TQ00_WICPI|nr:hypothetical protein WICPIJ_002585 [Wickerhamomyces pijperi]
MLSMQSTMKVGLPFSNSSSALGRCHSWLIASISTHGAIFFKCVFKHSTLEVPTSSKVATECLLSEDRETWSKSMTLILETPALTNMVQTQEPTPPAPTTTMNWSRTASIPSLPRKA